MKIPPYTTAAVFLLAVDAEDGKIYGIPALLENEMDTDLEAIIEAIYNSMTEKGLRRPTMEEYINHCKEATAAQQGRRLIEAMVERMRGHDLSPEQMDELLRNHRGEKN